VAHGEETVVGHYEALGRLVCIIKNPLLYKLRELTVNSPTSIFACARLPGAVNYAALMRYPLGPLESRAKSQERQVSLCRLDHVPDIIDIIVISDIIGRFYPGAVIISQIAQSAKRAFRIDATASDRR